MASDTIVVNWQSNQEIEFITLDPSLDYQDISNTREWWGPDKQFYIYNTRGVSKKQIDGTLYIEITYMQEDNPSYIDTEWGTSYLFIEPDQTKGKLNWKPLDGKPDQFSWYKFSRDIPSGFFEEKKKKPRNVVSRDMMFRLAVLNEDGQCAITGEITPEVLDAAHIIPVAKQGADIINNAILLRTDLHRLFDRFFFTINENGYVELTDKYNLLSEYYFKILNGASLPSNILKRVMPNLSQLKKI